MLHEDVATYFESTLSPEVSRQTVDGGHGRVETRSLRVSDEINGLENKHAWAGLKSILAVMAKRKVGEKVTKKHAISSAA